MTLFVLPICNGATGTTWRRMLIHATRTSAITQSDPGLNSAAAQAQAKELEEQIHSKATSKVTQLPLARASGI
jgi:hypothetical protein